jgi:RNA polymerase sigma-70 factor (ECF subfamily)
MFGIARNAALDELRRRRRRADVEVDPVDLRAGPSESAETELRRATVRTAVLSLSPRDRDIVALKFAGGLSNGEIARVLGVSESSAGTRLHRTIEKLRKACHEEV